MKVPKAHKAPRELPVPPARKVPRELPAQLDPLALKVRRAFRVLKVRLVRSGQQPSRHVATGVGDVVCRWRRRSVPREAHLLRSDQLDEPNPPSSPNTSNTWWAYLALAGAQGPRAHKAPLVRKDRPALRVLKVPQVQLAQLVPLEHKGHKVIQVQPGPPEPRVRKAHLDQQVRLAPRVLLARKAQPVPKVSRAQKGRPAIRLICPTDPFLAASSTIQRNRHSGSPRWRCSRCRMDTRS